MREAITVKSLVAFENLYQAITDNTGILSFSPAIGGKCEVHVTMDLFLELVDGMGVFVKDSPYCEGCRQKRITFGGVDIFALYQVDEEEDGLQAD